MDLYQDLIRQVLFRMSAESAHQFGYVMFRWPLLWQFLGVHRANDPRLTVDLHGLRLPNPVGLAPGFDKDCDLLPSLMHLGFGYLAPGSILRDVRPGNPHPRLERIIEQQAVLNCMGLPSKGRAHAIHNLKRLKHHRVPIIAEVQGASPADAIDTLVAVQPYADGVQVALACPNASDTSGNDELSTSIEIIKGAAKVRRRPVFVKVPNALRFASRELATFLDVCIDSGIEGVIAAATRRYKTDQLSAGVGSLAGKPIFQDTLAFVREVAAHARGRLSIIASGGVFTGQDAYDMLTAGASVVEIYSAMIYRGWRAPALINRELVEVLNTKGIRTIQSLVDDVRNDLLGATVN